ncbi:hypothetical protein K1T71_007351 [Dendrolimus kikuchii]|uniref:Uncharacterized protein n=1 Tax=Dendrolimus kikuchii TaxID=765133 RepID=A0ACC1D1D8_9NEOP|nr:hypothetical protein K1T71_007351 [Dendrolimus kikuchii]
MYEFYEEERKMRGTLRDWRKALRTPATYRVGNAVRIQPQFILLVILVGLFLLVLFYYNWWTSQMHSTEKWMTSVRLYNNTYPLTAPIKTGDLISYRIGIIADLDTNSKSSKPDVFNSYFKKGYLSYHAVTKEVAVTWDSRPPILLSSSYSHKGRGMELSELIVYDGRLLTFDDRSGMVFEIMDNKMVPWLVLVDGNGHIDKGFKSEWATIKDNILYRCSGVSLFMMNCQTKLRINHLTAVKSVITKHEPKLGFSSFKFIPGTSDEAIVALKTTEFEGKTATYITAFTTDGKVLLENTHIENLKYEGIEFI